MKTHIDKNLCNVCRRVISIVNDCSQCLEYALYKMDKQHLVEEFQIIPNYDYKLDENYNDPLYAAYRNNPELLEQLDEEL